MDGPLGYSRSLRNTRFHLGPTHMHTDNCPRLRNLIPEPVSFPTTAFDTRGVTVGAKVV